MRKVTIYFKSGRKVSFRCKNFDFNVESSSNKRSLEMNGVPKPIERWMIDLTEIECFIVKRCYFYYL